MSVFTEQDVRAEIERLHDDLSRKRGSGGWRAVGDLLGVSGAYARQLARGDRPITPAVVEAWLVATHRRPRLVETPACPDCGVVHNGGRCNGQPVTVRLVRPDGTSNRKRYWRPCLPVNLSADQKRRIMKIAEE